MAVLIFEVLLNATAMFNHSNVSLPLGFDKAFALARCHAGHAPRPHSIIPSETNSNFGFICPGGPITRTYRAQPKQGHLAMTIGVEQFRTSRDLWLDRMLIQPILGPLAITRSTANTKRHKPCNATFSVSCWLLR